ncbi:MAG: fumarate hydratase [Chloroflexi bacterium]|nr:fumarate hydratase [Chloroflexota bacterium]
MREIHVHKIIETVKNLCIDANYYLGDDVICALVDARQAEESQVGQDVLDQILENVEIAHMEKAAMCQDTGVAVVFLEIGQDVHIVGGDLYEAVNEGVRQGYEEGYLRKSMVKNVFDRVNTKDNTPAVIHTDIVPGEDINIIVAPKGGGSENMSLVKMLPPSAGRNGVVDLVVKTVCEAGANPCPPVVVGVGLGGTYEKAALLGKKALLREIGSPNPDTELAGMEKEILKKINDCGVGPQGFGGRVTALAVHIESFPCHIASLPVGININCHVARHKEAVI